MSLDDLFSVRSSANANASQIRNLKAIQISIASPENIREWSYGEVKSRRPSTTVRSSPNATACSARRSSAR